jgi:geranylgeranyl diphosphate synthase type I
MATSEADLKVLDLVGTDDLSSDEVAAIQQVIVDTGALAEIDARIDALTTQAIGAIHRAPITKAACESLVDLAHYVAARDT